MMYVVAEDHGFVRHYEDTLHKLTAIKHAVGEILILAVESNLGSDHSARVPTGIPELTDMEIRVVVDLVGRKDPDNISMLEKCIAPLIVKEFGSSGLLYDLSAVSYYGTENDLAGYSHYYPSIGENREINFVLAVTGRGGVSVHHRPLAGSIPSVSTMRGFTGDLKDFSILSILIVIYREFYSSDNLKDLKNYNVIRALSSTVGIHDDLIKESRGIENSRNYFQ
ncbi:MAG: hypothetical protein QXU18_00165 [Thermoplasmatales archaeon]